MRLDISSCTREEARQFAKLIGVRRGRNFSDTLQNIIKSEKVNVVVEIKPQSVMFADDTQVPAWLLRQRGKSRKELAT